MVSWVIAQLLIFSNVLCRYWSLSLLKLKVKKVFRVPLFVHNINVQTMEMYIIDSEGQVFSLHTGGLINESSSLIIHELKMHLISTN